LIVVVVVAIAAVAAFAVVAVVVAAAVVVVHDLHTLRNKGASVVLSVGCQLTDGYGLCAVTRS